MYKQYILQYRALLTNVHTKMDKGMNESWQSSTGDTKRKTYFKANNFETSHEIQYGMYKPISSTISAFGDFRIRFPLFRFRSLQRPSCDRAISRSLIPCRHSIGQFS